MSIKIYFLLILLIPLEFTSNCETTTNEESHEENKPFINQDIEKNAVSREQGKLSNK